MQFVPGVRLPGPTPLAVGGGTGCAGCVAYDVPLRLKGDIYLGPTSLAAGGEMGWEGCVPLVHGCQIVVASQKGAKKAQNSNWKMQPEKIKFGGDVCYFFYDFGSQICLFFSGV